MKKIHIIALILISVGGLIAYWYTQPELELGKYETLQEAIEKAIPYEVNNVIHKEIYDGVTIIMYTTDPDKEELPLANYEALAVAFFTGNDKDGWENIGHHGWTHYENENLTVYIEPLRDFKDTGETIHEFYVVFGEINNPEIVRVETKSPEEKNFEEAKILTKYGRYYFKIGRETTVRGLSEDGVVLDQQGG